MKHKIYLLGVLIALSSCMKLKKKSADADASPSASVEASELQSSKNLTVNEFGYEYVFDKYRSFQEVKFNFPSSWPDEIIMIETELDEQKIEKKSVLRDNETRVKIVPLMSKYKVSYKFYKSVAENLELLDEAEVLPVLDLELATDLNIAQQFNLNAKTKTIFIANLRIDENAHLFLENYSGRIQIANLESKFGFIQTFDSNQRAPLGLDGRSGGSVTIEIANAQGELNLVMIGEKGGDGDNAAEPSESKRGMKGIDGEKSKYNLKDISSFLPGGFVCVKAGTKGLNGGKGIRGDDGGDGKNGGHSGKAIVKLAAGALLINSQNKGGVKGLGSLAGLGGPGGIGGKTGTESDPDQVCGSVPAGSEGPQGDSGKDGHDGEDGVASKNQLFINGLKADFESEN